MNRLLREELRDVLATVGTGRAQAQAERRAAEETMQTQESKEAFDTAYDIVQNALAVGLWTDEDAHALRDAFVKLTGVKQEEILQFLIVAMNNGEIAIETTGPLF